MLTLLLGGKLYLAPIDEENCRRVLDVGCGTGIWAIDFADAYPSAEVTGLDLSPIQPAWVPPNCHFMIDDVEDDWTFPSNYFDFVHIRCLMGSISKWPELYRQAYDRLVPAGYVQHLEMSIEFTSDDGTVGSDHIMAEWSRTFIGAGEMMGKTFKIANNASKWIKDAGFEDVHEQCWKVPVGRWPKDKVSRNNLRS
jgi:SAM-dependent methyltransferase